MDADIQRVDESIEGAPAAQPPVSVLDRGFAMPITSAVVVSAVAILAAALLRLPELARWALSPEEGSVALAARNLVRGAMLPDTMLGKPFVVEWIALFMFLGDTNISVGRVAIAVAGVIGIIGILTLRPRFGTMPVAAAALLLALSPTMVAASRSMDGGILVVTLSILLFAAVLRATDSRGPVYSAIAGITLALLLLAGPLGLPAVLITLIGIYLAAGADGGIDRRQITFAAFGFAAAFILFSSALLTQPSSIVEAPLESLSILWDDHISTFGDGAQLPLWNLLLNEPLLIVLAIAGFIWRRDSDVVRGLAAWWVVSFVVMSILGNSDAGGYGLTVLPLGLLAGFGAVELVGRLQGTVERPAWVAAFAGALVVLVFAFISLAGLASPVDGRSTSEVVVRFLLVAIVALAPAGFLIVKAGERLPGLRIALVLAVVTIIIGGITLRSAVLSATEWPGQPGNGISARAMGDDIPVVVDRIYRISRDLTRTERDARMPVGGIALRIALDQEIEQPFAWYFREFPNLTIFDPATESLPTDTQVAILAGSRDPEQITPGLSGATYILQYDEPDYVAAPGWGDMAADVFQLDGWRHFFSFLLNRETSEPVPATEFHLQAIPLIAERFAVATGPYGIDDQAGIGTAGGQFNQPRGITIDDQGGIFVVDGGNTRVQHFDAIGSFDQAIGEAVLAPFPGGTGGAGGIAIDDSGNIYVADTWNHQIKVFAPSGELLRSWGSFFDAQDDPELTASQPGQFYGPRDVAIHDGQVYVTDTGNERVQIFTLEGEFVTMFGQFGSEVGQLIEPVGIAVSADGTIFVADSHNARLSRFSADGEPLDPWPVESWTDQQFFEPYVTVGPDGRVFASDPVNGQIIVFDETGQQLDAIDDPSLLRPYDMAITSDGLQMLVTDGLTNSVIRLSLSPVG